MTTKLITSQITHSGTPLNTVIDAKIGVVIDYSTAWDPPSVSSLSNQIQVFTVTGAVMGDFVQASFTQNQAALILEEYVSAADQVTVVLFNPTLSTINLAAGTLKLRLTRSA